MSSPLSAEFVCAHGCAFRASLLEVVYRCPSCGGLLEVRHALAPLKERSGAEWRALFDARLGASALPLASGVWGKREWVLPGIEDRHIVSLGEGRQPLLPLTEVARELGLEWVELKQCGISPTGSFKDLGMTVLVSAVVAMRAAGRPVRAVVCASTGDTSAALSAYCARARIPCVVLLPRDKVTVSQLLQPVANGAHVLSVDTDFDGCMALIQQLTEEGGLYLANSMNSLRLEGQKTVAIELCQQLAWEAPDWIVVPGGNLGNAAALGKGLELMLELQLLLRRPRIAVVQAEAANPLARAFREGKLVLTPQRARATLATAIQIGNPVSFQRAARVIEAFEGVVEDATEAELADAAAQADREGAFVCPQTGVALAGMMKLARRGVIARGSRVVVISTAHGLKFPAFKEAYHRRTLEGVTPRFDNPPVEVQASLSAVLQALDRRLEER